MEHLPRYPKAVLAHAVGLLFLMVAGLSFPAKAQTPETNDLHWTLVWHDDFIAKPELDPASWRLDSCWLQDDSAAAIFIEPNAVFTPGGLDLKVKYEEVDCSPNFRHYSSAQLTSNYPPTYPATPNYQVDRVVKYGYVEAQVRLSDQYGEFPAFWLWLDTDYDDPTTPHDYEEIDIFEMIPGNTPDGIGVQDKYAMTTNWHNAGDNTGTIDGRKINFINDYTQPHRYAVEWTPNKVIWFVDDQIVRIEQNPKDFEHIHHSLRVLLDNTLNSTVAYPSAYDPGYNAAQALDYFHDLNSASMYVEWISYYTMVNDCGTELTIGNDAQLNAYDSKVKKWIRVDGSPVTVSSNSPRSLRASEKICIEGEFEVPIGQDFYMDVNNCYAPYYP